MTIFASDLLRFIQGQGGQDRMQRPDGNLFDTTTVTGNGADTTDDVIFTYALPANILDAPSREVTITAFGDFAATANNKRVKLWWGTTTQTLGLVVAGGVLIGDSGVVTVNNGGWNLNGNIFKAGALGANTQKAQAQIVAGTTHTGTQKTVQLTANELAIINVTLTGSSPTTGAANDVVGQGFQVNFQN